MNLTPQKTLFFFLIIIFLNLLAYGPSFFDPPRSDQIVYLGNTSGQKDLYSLAIKNYAYNRSHQMYGLPGDDALFRPVIFFLLGIQRWAFGYHFLYWQLSSFFLHLIVLWFLLKTLLKIHPGRGAFFLVALFSLIPSNNDMVTWHHINSYLVAIACLLVALNKIWLARNDKLIPWPTVLTITFLMTVASLIYEVCALYALLLAGYLVFRHSRGNLSPRIRSIGQGLVITLSAASRIIFSQLDIISRGSKQLMAASGPLSYEFLVNGLNQIVPVSFWWLYSGAFPTQLKIFPYQRTMVLPYYAFAEGSPISYDLWALLSVGVSSGLIIIYFHFIKKAFSIDGIKRAALPAVMLMLFIITISVGRISHGEARFKLAESAYNGYLFWLFALISAYALFPFKTLRPTERPSFLKRAVWLLLTAAITLNFLVTFEVNKRRSHQMGFQKRLLAETRKLVNQHGAQEGFSFNVSDAVKDHVYADWITNNDDPSHQGYVYLQLLYPDYYTDKDPEFTYSADQVFQRNIAP